MNDLTAEQIKTILAAYLGWMLDAFDFFILTFVLKDIAKGSASMCRRSPMRCS